MKQVDEGYFQLAKRCKWILRAALANRRFPDGA